MENTKEVAKKLFGNVVMYSGAIYSHWRMKGILQPQKQQYGVKVYPSLLDKKASYSAGASYI